MMLGTLAVGKTSLSRRFALGTFDSNYKSTIGVDIYEHDTASSSDETLRLMIWDAEGNFLEDALKSIYLRGASAGLMIGDISRPRTFDQMKRYSTAFQKSLPGRPLLFILNKTDLLEDEVCKRRCQDAEEILGEKVYLTSAANNFNVDDVFRALADQLLKLDS